MTFFSRRHKIQAVFLGHDPVVYNGYKGHVPIILLGYREMVSDRILFLKCAITDVSYKNCVLLKPHLSLLFVSTLVLQWYNSFSKAKTTV